MLVTDNTPPPSGFMDRVRDLIAKIFGLPGRAPQGAEPVATAGTDGKNPKRPTNKTTRAIAAGGAVATV